MQNVSWQTLKRIKKSDYNEDVVKQVDSLRNKAKDEVKKLQEELFSRKPESFLRDFQDMHSIRKACSTCKSIYRAFPSDEAR